MNGWLGNIRADIREKTAGMDARQKAEYILTYYWYHLLFLFLGIGLLILLVRHLFFGEPPKEFICILVNQATDYERDGRLAEDFAEACGIPKERILVDSSYVFSYDEVRLEGANESSYEKFFFRWGTGEMDAVIMPRSFYEHCRALEYEFSEELGVHDAGGRLASYLEPAGEEDPPVLVFPAGSVHMEAGRAFLKFAEGGSGI